MEINNILLIHLRRIGDILLTTPAVRAIREFYPDKKITYLTEEPFYEVLSGNPYLDNVILLQEDEKKDMKKYLQFLRNIRKKRFDLVIDFYGNPRSSLIAFVTGAKHRIGYTYPVRQYLYNTRVPVNANERYVVQVKFDLLRSIGIQCENEKLDIFISQNTRNKVDTFLREKGVDDFTKLIAFSPTSRRRTRRWLPERFAELGDRLIDSGKKVLFVWGPGEKEYIDSIVSIMKRKPIVSFESSVKESAALLERCRLLVTNFNGSKHLAVAVGTPTIGLCEPSEVPCWNPASNMHIAIFKDVPCAGCKKKEECLEMTCMKLIKVDEVERIVDKMINMKCSV